MTASNGNGKGWGRFTIGLLVPLAGFLVGYGVLKSDVANARRELETKASREVVSAQYESIIREIQSLRAEVQQMRRRP